MASSVSAFGLPATKTLIKRNQMAKLAMAETPSGEIPRGGEAAATGGGTATIPTEVFNLVKSIAGAGVLSLPAGECEICVCVSRTIYAVICFTTPFRCTAEAP